MLDKSFTPNHTKLTSSKGTFFLWHRHCQAKGLPMEGPFLFSPFQFPPSCRELQSIGACRTEELPRPKKQRPFQAWRNLCHSAGLSLNSMDILVDPGVISLGKNCVKKVMIGHGLQRHAWVIHHQSLFSVLNDGCQHWLFRLVMPDLGAFFGRLMGQRASALCAC